MSEEPTRDAPHGLTFEERVFARFDALDTRLSGVDSRLTQLEEKVERRLHDTRPIWEQVLARLDALDTRMGNLEAEVRIGFRRLSRGISVLSKDVIEVRSAQEDLEARMDKMEDRPAK